MIVYTKLWDYVPVLKATFRLAGRINAFLCRLVMKSKKPVGW